MSDPASQVCCACCKRIAEVNLAGPRAFFAGSMKEVLFQEVFVWVWNKRGPSKTQATRAGMSEMGAAVSRQRPPASRIFSRFQRFSACQRIGLKWNVLRIVSEDAFCDAILPMRRRHSIRSRGTSAGELFGGMPSPARRGSKAGPSPALLDPALARICAWRTRGLVGSGAGNRHVAARGGGIDG